MKARTWFVLFLALSFSFVKQGRAIDKRAGFYMPDSLRETSIHYQPISNLIVLSVKINNNLNVNLILDTGCRNIVLFGKKFQKLFTLSQNRKIKFSGLGQGKAVEGDLSLGNLISIGSIKGELMPIVIVPSKNIFAAMDHVDGVIGYDLFLRLELEFNPIQNKITFRSATNGALSEGYTQIPIRIEDARLLLNSSLFFQNKNQSCELMIDTGSALGLLLKTTDLSQFNIAGRNIQVGRGLNGPIEAYELTIDKLGLTGYDINNIQASITKSPWHNYASLGMDVLKDYHMIINYHKGYIALKPL